MVPKLELTGDVVDDGRGPAEHENYQEHDDHERVRRCHDVDAEAREVLLEQVALGGGHAWFGVVCES